MRRAAFLLVALVLASQTLRADGGDERLTTLEQQLICACLETNINSVLKTILDGADVNGRFQSGPMSCFIDRSTGGRVLLAHEYTPLMACCLARPSSNYAAGSQSIEMPEDSIFVIDESSSQGKKRRRDRLEIFRILLSHGAEVSASLSTGQTCIDIARESRSDLLIQVLSEKDNQFGQTKQKQPTPETASPNGAAKTGTSE